jgi:hypothetical protein
LRFVLALGERRVRFAGIDLYLCLGLCLLTGLPDGHGLVLSNIRTRLSRCLHHHKPGAGSQAGRRPKEEAVNTDSNARFGGEVEWNVNGTMIFLRCSWFEVTLL